MDNRNRQHGAADMALSAPVADVDAPVAIAGSGSLGAVVRSAVLIAQAAVGSTLHRLRRGEGALLAINLSLIALGPASFPLGVAETLVSLLAIFSMYAFNDVWDAPVDRTNPRKDRELVATYIAYRTSATVSILALKLATIALAAATLSPRAAVATASVLGVNLVYSTLLKGVPIVDVAWCGVWGALYAAIVTASPVLLPIVGVMTAVCHLYQTLNDRISDAASGIVTTAVRSSSLSTGVLAALSILLFFTLRAPLGPWAVSAVKQLQIHLLDRRAGAGWLLTKLYFGIVWLAMLGAGRAIG
jgi:4-hydroxybenzoate polyprenyltransferase